MCLVPSSLLGKGRGSLSERTLHQDDVDPAAEFEPDRLESAHMGEPERFMKPDRGYRLPAADHGDHLAVSQRLAAREHLLQQRATDAAPHLSRVDIDRILERETIPASRPKQPGIAVSDDTTAAFGNDIRQVAGQNLVTAAAHFAGRG